MCTKNDAEIIIDNYLNKDRLKKIIMKTSIVAWNTSISDTAIERWLSNFTGLYFSSVELEQKLALWMLAHFTYYSNSDVRVLCKDLFNLLLHQKLLENKNVKFFDEVLNELIEDTLFIGLGNASESGQSILYYFRQENKLSKKCFEPQSNHAYKNLIFLDDISMSGSQACNYINGYNISSEKKYVGFLIATEDAMNKIKKTAPDIIPISTMVLDKRDQAFCEESFVFSNPKVKDIISYARDFCYVYGKIAVEDEQYMKNHPLGFNDGAYLIGFEYNTPDNTLPIFWGTSNNWKPIFTRHEKIYGNGKESAIDGRKYY